MPRSGFAAAHTGPGRMMIELRTIAEPASVLNGVRTAIESLDRDLPMIDVRTMKERSSQLWRTNVLLRS